LPQGHDLSYRAFIKSGNIPIDTSQVATDTIDYVATDTWGNSATSTRTVIIEADRSFNSSGTKRLNKLLLCAAFHKILPLWADDLLIDCLFEAVKVSLCHAKLHLISLLLASHSL
jgi:hypothetical protein